MVIRSTLHATWKLLAPFSSQLPYEWAESHPIRMGVDEFNNPTFRIRAFLGSSGTGAATAKLRHVLAEELHDQVYIYI